MTTNITDMSRAINVVTNAIFRIFLGIILLAFCDRIISSCDPYISELPAAVNVPYDCGWPSNAVGNINRKI